jgi:hypothetical protein
VRVLGLQLLGPRVHSLLHPARRRPPLRAPGSNFDNYFLTANFNTIGATANRSAVTRNFSYRNAIQSSVQRFMLLFTNSLSNLCKGCVRAVEGSTQHCFNHGGGKRCAKDQCAKLAKGATPFCIAQCVCPSLSPRLSTRLSSPLSAWPVGVWVGGCVSTAGYPTRGAPGCRDASSRTRAPASFSLWDCDGRRRKSVGVAAGSGKALTSPTPSVQRGCTSRSRGHTRCRKSSSGLRFSAKDPL